MAPLKHLSPSVRPLVEQAENERIESLREDRWIDYPRAQQAIGRLQWMLTSPNTTRMPGLLIYGDSSIGKSMVIQKFLRSNTDDSKTARASATSDIISIQMPAAPQEKRLYTQLLMAMHYPCRSTETLSAIEGRALLALDEAKPKMIIVDEVHNLLAGSAREQRASLNLLKFLSNRLHCSLVVLGTKDALAATQTDEQIASRLPGYELPRWKKNDELRGFLAGYERQLPLKEPSNIANNPQVVNALVSASAGVTGRLCALLTQSARLAITSKQERITPELLKAVIGPDG